MCEHMVVSERFFVAYIYHQIVERNHKKNKVRFPLWFKVIYTYVKNKTNKQLKITRKRKTAGIQKKNF